MARPSDPHAKIDLLRAAECEFVEQGLEQARVEDITARAGRSKGSFYLHFKNKEDAFRQIVESMIARLATMLEELLEHKPLDFVEPHDMLQSCIEADVGVFEFLWQNRGVTRLLMTGGCSATFRYLIDEFADRARQNTKKLLAAGIQQGFYRQDLDVEVASLVIGGAYDRIARQLVTSPTKPDLVAWMKSLQRVIVGGIGGNRARDILDPPVRPRSPRSPAERATEERGSRARRPREAKPS